MHRLRRPQPPAVHSLKPCESCANTVASDTQHLLTLQPAPWSQMDMEDGDVIDVMVEQQGGAH